MANEIRRALGKLKSVDWVLRVHRKTPEADFFGDEDLAGVVDLIVASMNEAMLPYPRALGKPIEAVHPGT